MTKSLADTISTTIQNSKYQHTTEQSITFSRAGEKASHQPSASGGLLAEIGPENMATTRLRPGMVLISASAKQAVLLELTVAWEDRIEEANERKRAKYAGLVIEC